MTSSDEHAQPASDTPRWIGTLTHWDSERGFGLFTAEGEHEGREVAVHRTAFSRQDGEPGLGEVFSFEVHTSSSGKHRALRVQRPVSDIPGFNPYATRVLDGAEGRPFSSGRRRGQARTRPRKWLVLALVLIIGALLLRGAELTALLGMHTTP